MKRRDLARVHINETYADTGMLFLRMYRYPRTHVPSLQSPHVHIPVYSEQHDNGEHDHCKHSEKAHDNAVDHIEEKENE